jgi:hypothetical protein
MISISICDSQLDILSLLIMSTTFTTTRALGTAASKVDNVGVDVSEIRTPIMYTVDDLLFNRSQTIPELPLVAYPATAKGRSDYLHYTARDLDRFADHGAKKFASLGLQPKAGSTLKYGAELDLIVLVEPRS